ncbi:MAG: cobalamin-dependent protein, partial [Planctomycetota bacterium]
MNPTSTPTVGSHGGRKRLRMISPSYPAFNIYSHAAKYMTALGPVCVATAVNDIPGWDAEVIDENGFRDGPVDENGICDPLALQAMRPADVIGLYGGLTSTIPRLLEIAKVYQSMGVCTVAGGQHFVKDNVPDALHGGVDVVVLGEGEKTIADLLACFETGGDLA